MTLKKNIRFFTIFLFAILFFTLSYLSIKESRKDIGTQFSATISNISPQAIKIVAGEFNGLLSDFILLQIASFTGSRRKTDLYSTTESNKIYLGFKQVIELDPYFEQSYLLAQSELAWVAKKPLQAIDILNKSRKKRTWDFRPGFYQGFDYYYFLGDYKNAASVFMETSKMKDPPLLVVLLASRFSVKEKQTETSLQLLLKINENPDLEEKYKKELEDRILALKGVLIIEKAINDYKNQYGDLPANIEALISSKILNRLPDNPYGVPYRYNREDNQALFDLAESKIAYKKDVSDDNYTSTIMILDYYFPQLLMEIINPTHSDKKAFSILRD